MKNNKSAEENVYLVTGAAGFIGYYLSKRLLEQGCRVIGVDNINDYYDVHLKYARLDALNLFEGFTFMKGDISESDFVEELFANNQPDIVVNLAAQAGVQYSAENPSSYIKSNIVGFYNILEACKLHPPRHLLYASSSSVYGASSKVPFEESDGADAPISLYAATKRSNELMAHTYSHLYKIPATGLRFFTVYGPMGRPDMAYYLFTQKYFAGQAIHIYNNGDFDNDLYRDFTYIDDIVDGILGILNLIPKGDTPHCIFNIGNNRPEKLMYFIETLEKALGSALGSTVTFGKIFEAKKPGDVPATYASIDRIKQATGFEPKTTIEEGLQKFADWYISYYSVE
jgi:UDP-glucuronate 4-epimerase